MSRDESSVQQISSTVLRDPSLTSRILKLTNSPFYSFANNISNLEEAVFYLGVAQIKRLVMVSPIIDQFEGLAQGTDFSWKEFWKHSMAVAAISQELLNQSGVKGDESGYLAGLLHDVGKIAIAIVFPDTFGTIQKLVHQTPRELRELEHDYFGMDHAEIGAFYFESQKIPDFLLQSTKYHHRPSEAEGSQRLTAAVYIADLAVRSAGIGLSGNPTIVAPSTWKSLEAWDLVLPDANSRTIQKVQRGLDKLMFKLPEMVEEFLGGNR